MRVVNYICHRVLFINHYILVTLHLIVRISVLIECLSGHLASDEASETSITTSYYKFNELLTYMQLHPS